MMNADLIPLIERARTLLEALPYMQNFRGATFLIKLGGSVLNDPQLRDSLLRDVVFLEVVGINPVLVHGGGKEITKALEEAELEARFIHGLRVTDAATIEIVEQTLDGQVNRQLVDQLNDFGARAVGISGKEVFAAQTLSSKDEEGNELDLGFVGEVTHCHLTKVREALLSEMVPIVSPLGKRASDGEILNINADLAASALAQELRADKLIYLSDVRGVMHDPRNPLSLIASMTKAQSEGLIAEQIIAGGMIPKVNSACEALEAGVSKVHLIDGRIPHSMLLEVFTDVGIGTEILH